MGIPYYFYNLTKKYKNAPIVFSRKKKFDEFFCVATSAIFADLFANLARIFLFKKKFELECVSVRECPWVDGSAGVNGICVSIWIVRGAR